MYQKMKKLTVNFCRLRFSAVLLIVLVLINFPIVKNHFTSNSNQKLSFFEYYEDDYKELENEASTLIRNKDFTTKYYLNILDYDNQSHYLSMNLSNDKALISVTVDNYGEKDQSIHIQRVYLNRSIFISLIAISFLCATAEEFCVFAVLLFLMLIFYILDKQKIKFQNKKES